jgi:Domain of unknown function (DUF4402)
MARFALLLAGLILSVARFAPANAQDVLSCQLCDADARAAQAAAAVPGQALNIRIEAELEFGVAAIGPNGGGMIAIDPRTDLRVVSGGLIDLGGSAFSGVVRLSGQPFRRVRITLPSVETMSAPGGGRARITGFASDIPETALLDASGNLLFHFSGRFVVSGGESGDFRGRVNISAVYE